jgi:type IV secretory pathway VirB10-like protein
MDPFDTGLRRRPRAVGLRLGVIFLVLVAVVGAWVGAYWWAKSQGHLKPIERAVAHYDYMWPHWMGKGAKKATYVKAPQDGKPMAAVDPRDEQLRRLQRELDEQRRLLELMRQQKPAPPPAPLKPAPVQEPKRKILDRASLVLFERKHPVTVANGALDLFAGTFIPVVLETRVNSERAGVAVARVRETVFDSRTGRVPLIPQGSLLVMPYDSEALIFGDQRMEVGLQTMTLPNGRVVELPKEPGVDQIGQAGWTGEVDTKFWTLLKAVLVRGVLRGSVAEVTSLGLPVASGITQEGSQVVQQQTQPWINARPTITVAEGERGTVILTRGLSLPAYRP